MFDAPQGFQCFGVPAALQCSLPGSHLSTWQDQCDMAASCSCCTPVLPAKTHPARLASERAAEVLVVWAALVGAVSAVRHAVAHPAGIDAPRAVAAGEQAGCLALLKEGKEEEERV